MVPSPTSVILGQIIGPVVLAFSAGLLLNRSLIRRHADEILSSVAINYLWGACDLAAGLAIVLFHNVWTWYWPVIITLFGWIWIGRGLLHLLVPRLSLGTEPKFISREAVLIPAIAAAALAGLVLSYFAYTAP